ncbi:MAG: PAS domain S-box protein [Bacteroidota bacterium]
MKISGENIRILIFNENETETTQICAALAKSDFTFDIEISRKQQDFVKLIRQEPDIIIAKPPNNKYTALDIYDDSRKAAPFVYFILVSSSFSEEETKGFMLTGIDYFLTPGNYDTLQFLVIQGFNKKHLERSFHDAKRALQEGNQRLRSVFNNDQNAVVFIGFKNEIIDFNPAALEVLEIKNLESLLGNNITRYIDDADLKKFRTAHAAAFRGKKCLEEFTLNISKKVKKQASINFVPVKNEDGVTTSVILICKDVTETFLFRQQFKMSEDRFMALANNAPVGIYYNNPDGKCVFVNKQWMEYSGLTFRESIGKGWINALHPEDRAEMESNSFENRLEMKEFTSDYRVVHTSGRLYWLRSKSSPFVDEKGKLLGYIGTVIDLTNDKLFGQEIAEVNKKLELTIKLAGLGAVERDFINKTGKWSDEVYQIFGIENTGKAPSLNETIEHYVHPNDREYVHHAFKNIQADTNQQQAEYRIITPAGKIKYVKSMFTFEKDAEGNPSKLFSAIKDITESKTLLKEIQEAEKRKKTVLELAGIGLWEMDLTIAKETPYWSENMFTLFERDKKLGSPTNKEFFEKYVHPTDKQYIKSLFNSFVPGETTEEIFYRIITPSDKTKFLSATITSEFDNAGKPCKVLGYMQDITSLLKHEREIRSNEDKFKYLFNNSPDGIYIEDLEGNILEVNEQACRIQGMEKHELLGKNILDLAPETLRAEISKKFTKMAQGEISMLHSFSWNKNGKRIPVQIKQNRIMYDLKPALLLHVRKVES